LHTASHLLVNKVSTWRSLEKKSTAKVIASFKRKVGGPPYNTQPSWWAFSFFLSNVALVVNVVGGETHQDVQRISRVSTKEPS